MLTGLHILLTYKCTYACDHCFLYCSPDQKEVFTIEKIGRIIDEAKKVPSINFIGFEGGEPFLYYGLLLESIKRVTRKGFNTAVETNCYWATTVEDAMYWLKPLKEAGLQMIEPGDDTYHWGEHMDTDTPGKIAASAAKKLDMDAHIICVEKPTVTVNEGHEKGEPIYSGGPKLRGRAVEKLIEDLPRQSCHGLTRCKFEKLDDPSRVHIDPLGNVHLCQGVLMGNLFETELSTMIKSYRPEKHPIVGPMLEGGPLSLQKKYDLEHEDTYVDECHFCTDMCKKLMDRFPQYLGPKNVYGMGPAEGE